MTPRLLVVDDLETNGRLLDAVFSGRGYEVDVVLSGAAALEVLAGGAVDLVILDVHMPGMDGYEVCRRIRDDPATSMIPVIMITAATSEERVRAIEAGADDFVLRPFDKAELLARVRSLLRVKAYHDQLSGQAAELAAFNRTLEERVEEQVGELEELRRLRRFLPQPLAAAVASADAGELLEPHRREVAVAVVELRGFTAFAAAAEPEEAAEALRDFHDLVGRAVGRHGASVGSFSGEAVMLFFNDPIPCDEPARKAVGLVVDVLDDVQELAAGWARRGHRLGAGAGVALGYATIGMFGFEGRWDYTVIGPVVGLAERLCEQAQPGEILVGQRTVATLDGVVPLERCADLVLRDLPEPQSTWRVVREGLPERSPAAVAPRAAAVAAGAGGGPDPDDAPACDLRVLGPLELRCFGREIVLRSPKERALLVLLAVNPGRPLGVERLADELWEGEVPESAVASLRVYVSRLRKALAGAGAEGVLVTRPSGYELRLAPEALDVTRFERQADAGLERVRAGEPEEAARLLGAALSLWRGEALVDAAGSALARAEAVRLEERRLACLEERIDAELAMGLEDHLVGELEALTMAHPLRERLWSLRMLALARAGRQPEALRAYQEVRRVLGEELGLEPSPALAQLERAIAAGDADAVLRLR